MNPSEGIHWTKCKFGYHDKKCETWRNKYKHWDCFLEDISFKDNLLEYKCLFCNKHCQHKFDEELKEQFLNTNKFPNYYNSKFIWSFEKTVYPYKYMDD